MKETKSSDVCSIGAFLAKLDDDQKTEHIVPSNENGELSVRKETLNCRHVRLDNAFVSHQCICVQVYCQYSLINDHILFVKELPIGE